MLFNGKRKAITFSFDDGTIEDVRLVKLFNKYNLKGTFNLNSGLLSSTANWKIGDIKEVIHLNYFDCPDLYSGHEIACHSYKHLRLQELDAKTLENEIKLDKKLLEFLYSCKVRGMAYPFNSYNNDVVKVLESNGIEYSRTTEETRSFSLPTELLKLKPTCHFKSSALLKLAEKFLTDGSDEDLLFYVWGHSYELVTEADWERFEKFCETVSNHADVFYGTNIEIIDCIHMDKN